MAALQARPGFDWSMVRWDDAHAPARDDCSLCGVEISEDAVPLRMWNERGDGCVFCDHCAEKAFGLLSFSEPDVGDETESK